MEGEIILTLMLAKRKMSVTQLSEKVGITMANISILKNGKAKAIKISTLTKLCEALECQPGDILEYREKRFNEKHFVMVGIILILMFQMSACDSTDFSEEISEKIGVDVSGGKKLRFLTHMEVFMEMEQHASLRVF